MFLKLFYLVHKVASLYTLERSKNSTLLVKTSCLNIGIYYLLTMFCNQVVNHSYIWSYLFTYLKTLIVGLGKLWSSSRKLKKLENAFYNIASYACRKPVAWYVLGKMVCEEISLFICFFIALNKLVCKRESNSLQTNLDRWNRLRRGLNFYSPNNLYSYYPC